MFLRTKIIPHTDRGDPTAVEQPNPGPSGSLSPFAVVVVVDLAGSLGCKE